MKFFSFVFLTAAVLFSTSGFADHRIEELEGRWFSTLWPNGSEFYEFTGIKPEGDRYIFQQKRTEGAGEVCLGSGIINLESGKVLSIEICPPRNGRERVFLNEWTIIADHDKYHLSGGYYVKGVSQFTSESLDKTLHDGGNDDDGDDHHDDH